LLFLLKCDWDIRTLCFCFSKCFRPDLDIGVLKACFKWYSFEIFHFYIFSPKIYLKYVFLFTGLHFLLNLHRKTIKTLNFVVFPFNTEKQARIHKLLHSLLFCAPKINLKHLILTFFCFFFALKSNLQPLIPTFSLYFNTKNPIYSTKFRAFPCTFNPSNKFNQKNPNPQNSTCPSSESLIPQLLAQVPKRSILTQLPPEPASSTPRFPIKFFRLNFLNSCWTPGARQRPFMCSSGASVSHVHAFRLRERTLKFAKAKLRKKKEGWGDWRKNAKQFVCLSLFWIVFVGLKGDEEREFVIELDLGVGRSGTLWVLRLE
jgi:hypothetical protein